MNKLGDSRENRESWQVFMSKIPNSSKSILHNSYTYCSHCAGASSEFSCINLSCFIDQIINIICRATKAASEMIPKENKTPKNVSVGSTNS